jgi:hypothetical protein
VTVVFEKQQQTNWCWATCVRMVALADGSSPPEQCAIVSHFLGVTGCCADGASDVCNQPLDAKLIPRLYNAFALAADPLAPGGAVTETIVRQALQVGPLVQLLLDLGSTYHYTLLTGTAAGGYAVVDPNYGASTASWALISSGFDQGGSVSAAWRVHPR